MLCKNVLLLPMCKHNLMPVSNFVRKGCTVVYGNGDKVDVTAKNGKPILSGHEINGLYYFNCETVDQNATENKTSASGTPAPGHGQPYENQSHSFFGLQVGKKIGTAAQDFSTRLLETHWCYGHLHFDKLRKLLGLKKGDNPDCAACTMAKSRQHTLSNTMPDRSSHVNHRVHMDMGFTRNSDHCFQLCVDDYTRESHLDVLDSKSESFSSFNLLRKHLDNKHAPWKLAFMRSDAESIYSTPEWKAYREGNGVKHEISGRYRHDQNGVVERAMQAIGVSFRCMMIQGCAPASDIPDCLRHANVIRNNSPTKANKGWTPKEKAAGMRLPINKRLLRGPFAACSSHMCTRQRDTNMTHAESHACTWVTTMRVTLT